VAHEVDIPVTELKLDAIELSLPHDGGLELLCTFFTRSDTTLTKATLSWCHFGTAQDAAQLLAAFETNRTVTDLTIYRIRNLHGTALGNSLSRLLQNMSHLQRLACTSLYADGVQAFRPALQANRTLREWDLEKG
jgi:hypothetical protein